ncbi:MAG: DNA recombination protein RmuC [Thioalkalispiraceae bacterium]|jgi:DNA recombination protein RmuC
MITDTQLYIILAAIGGVIVGALVSTILYQRKNSALHNLNTELKTKLEFEIRNHQEKLKTFEQARQQLSETFSALSSQALKHNNESFLKLAQENLKHFQTKASGDLEQREKAIENLVKPIREALEKTEKQIQNIEKDRKESYGALNSHLESMARTQQGLQDQTQQLVNALRRPEVRGQWGELTLKRLAELAGMVEYCDFYEQQHVNTEDGRLRPDMIIKMPDQREIVVDVKTPLDAYLSAIEATDDETRRTHLARHAKNVRQRVNELSQKSYWAQFKNAPNFVVLFIPGDQFLSSALDVDKKLLEDALRQQVILATPTSLVALLRAVAYGWRQEQLAKNAEVIRKVGEDLFNRLNSFSEHLQKLGRSLESSLKSYNRAVGSFDSRVLPGARKFTELGISNGKKLEEPQQIETAVKQADAAPPLDKELIDESLK